MEDKLTSDTIGEIAKALAKAQGDLEAVPKGKTASIKSDKGASYSYHYADLASCLGALREVLPGCGIAYVQVFEPCPQGEVRLRTTAMHVSGEWIASVLTMPVPGKADDPKKIGAIQSYARRYAICSLFGLATEDDEKKLPKGGRGENMQSADALEKRSINHQITENMRMLGWGQDETRAWFESWAQDKGIDPEKGVQALSVNQLRAFENILAMEALAASAPWGDDPKVAEKELAKHEAAKVFAEKVQKRKFPDPDSGAAPAYTETDFQEEA